jgi:hypothetical protein
MATLSEIRDEMRAILPTNYFASTLTDARVTKYINAAQRIICDAHNFTWMETEAETNTADLQRRYALPTAGTDVNGRKVLAFKSELAIELINFENSRVPLKKWFKSAIEEHSDHDDVTDRGIPTTYSVQGGTIDLFPLPDHEYNDDDPWTINYEYYGYLTALSADGDSNALTTSGQGEEAITLYALSRCYRFGGDAEKQRQCLEQFGGLLAKLTEDDRTVALTGMEQGMRPRSGDEIGG